MEKKLTIHDIAELSGAAKSKVSRYLNGGSVREETGRKRKKVIEAYHTESNFQTCCSMGPKRCLRLKEWPVY